MTSVDFALLTIERGRYEHLFDNLTGLPKWALFIDRTAVALARARRTGNQVAVFAIEDPRFGTPPHNIAAVVSALQEQIRPDDTLARIGDRRFAVMCSEIRADEDAALVARRLIYGTGIICGLGVALGRAADSPEALIGRALLEVTRTTPAA